MICQACGACWPTLSIGTRSNAGLMGFFWSKRREPFVYFKADSGVG
jgi:hypothetical protein